MHWNSIVLERSIFLIFFALSFFCCEVAAREGEGDLEKGISYYENRYSWVPNFSSHPENVDLSIKHLEKAFLDPDTRESAGEHLLWAYFFKAMFICEDHACKKQVFADGKNLGEKLTKEYPDNINIKFGYSTNLGKWSEINGLFASACQGVAGKIKSTLDDAMKINPDYEDGLAYRLKSILYYKAPYIPLVVPWANKDEAFEMSRLTVKKWPNSIGNFLTLGELYYWDENYTEAREVFVQMQKLEPRRDHYILDQYEKDKAIRYIDEIDRLLAQSKLD